MTEPMQTGDKRAASGVAFRAVALLVFSALLFFSLFKLSEYQPEFHIGFSRDWGQRIYVPALLTAAFGVAFVFAEFSFGYFVGFYLFTMMAGYFWLNTFSVLQYDHRSALISAAASLLLFLLPSLTMRGRPAFSLQLPPRLFRIVPALVLGLGVAVLALAALDGFHLVGLDLMDRYRNELVHSRLTNYAIGNLIGALIPFAFACCLERRRWMMMVALSMLALLLYPVTWTKTAVSVAPFLWFMIALSGRLEARTAVILSMLLPLAAGVYTVAGLDWIDVSRLRLTIFTFLNLRLFAVPGISLEHYYAFFSDHPLTYFCQLSILKSFVSCPYSDQLGVVLANAYHLGNMNASLFATEGVASVGVAWAPLAALACGLVIALGNVASSGLPARFILISGAIVPHTLLNVPLSTTLLSNGLGLLMLLWLITPREPP
ncbi:hypothetical protein [Bradyrhizobium australiense]|uniref:Oligosaccharide repeat unit polymerase n=1 Tax=Bradyrhizobium australiense TaxID=2721161 RepID=A0A7Y4LYR6_9BRAD|nr:hypothetical protein [Bradyrhizobium australiense]NOJ43546.1 hypothetical protein [Bradyrhizobium australiense]